MEFTLPEHNIYVLGATSALSDKDTETLEDIMLLSNDNDQLKYFREYQDENTAIIKQCVGYVLIDSINTYENFIRDFFNEKELDKGQIPKKLSKTFMIYDSLARAKNMMTNLKQKQDSYYDALLSTDKPYARKQQLNVYDFAYLIADYNRRIYLPHIVNHEA